MEAVDLTIITATILCLIFLTAIGSLERRKEHNDLMEYLNNNTKIIQIHTITGE